MLRFTVGGERIEVAQSAVVVAGWTGRDPAAVEHHVEELVRIGVARPSAIPLYYRVSASAAVQCEVIEVVGEDTSGEVEPVLVATEAGLLLTVGSDHTDRALEAHSVALSKQVAQKPLARAAWRLDALAELDGLTLTSSIAGDDGIFEPYQAGTVAAIRPLDELLEGVRTALGGLPSGTVIYCGTLPTLSGKLLPARQFSATLSDPATGEELALAYRVDSLPLVA